jgi:hypothetical protein
MKMPQNPVRITEAEVKYGTKYTGIIARLHTKVGEKKVSFQVISKGVNNSWPDKRWRDTLAGIPKTESKLDEIQPEPTDPPQDEREQEREIEATTEVAHDNKKDMF